ncbi:MAG: N-formylglutamate amidohydrolase [Spirochaetales bacterium]|nr:N-formylglutamate amidohydrolase [Spirochaetales bacterium]
MIILHIPHSSTYIPEEVKKAFVLTESGIKTQILLLADMHTDKLFSFEHPLVQRIVYPVSRFVVDPERFCEDDKEEMASIGMGVIYTKTTDLTTLRRNPTEKEREELLNRYYHPHHKKLTDAVDTVLSRYGKCLIIDCHSFSSAPLPYEKDQSPDRPDICIGTDSYHTSQELFDTVLSFWAKAGFDTAVNRPFPGTIVPLKHYHENPAVQSVMFEMNKRLYMDEKTGECITRFKEIKSRIDEVIINLIDI